MSKRPAVRYYCYIGTNGLCIAAKDYVASLYMKGVDVDVRPLNQAKRPIKGVSAVDDILALSYEKRVNYDTVIAHCIPNRFKEIREREGNVHIIGLVVWETTKLPQDYIDSLKYADEFVVPCEWNKSLFAQYTKKKISVVHHVIQCPTAQYPIMLPSSFIFYFIGEWCQRKGIEDLIRIFTKTFFRKEKVLLYIKTFIFDNVMSSCEFEDYLTQKHRSQNIIINTEKSSDDFISALHQRADCYVSLARGEGVGIPICQAEAYGNRTMCMGFGGQIDYLSDPIIIDHKLIDCDPCTSYHGNKCGTTCSLYKCYTGMNQKWAVHTSDDAVGKQMMKVYDERHVVRQRRAKHGKFTLETIGIKMKKLL